MLAVGWGRLARPGDVLDVVAADRYQGGDVLRPECSDDAGGAAAPVIAGECCLLEAERVEKLQEVMAECGLLARSRGLRVEKPGRPVAAQIRHEHTPAGSGEQRRDTVVCAHIVGKAV